MGTAKFALAQCGGNTLWALDMNQPFNHNGEWWFDTGNYNGEEQTYTSGSEAGQHIYTSGGNLVVQATQTAASGWKWRSARAVLNHGWNQNFYAEVQLRLDNPVAGAFPAVWMLPTSGPGWPTGGEIDIFEFQTGFAGIPTPQTLHFQDRHAGNAMSFKNCNFGETNWVTLGVEVTESRIRFWCNGHINGEYNKPGNANQNNWPYNGNYPFGFILNYAVNPAWDHGNAAKLVPYGVNTLTMFIRSLVVRSCYASDDVLASNAVTMTNATIA
eukprot:TRINITY_DN12794_c0_g1_i2.p1 TRINITY_DN12794_c0_g1~~TRINITY_DN12794_c0_g1_i2.p1  ORF type:complete len:300 (-),score=70.93 TRINITY_DN12794_c0_g1_i2:165-977(-)